MIRIASIQTDVVFNDPAANAAVAAQELALAAADGAQLAVFPEAFFTGYCVDDFEEAMSIGISRSSDAVQAFVQSCADNDVIGIAGFVERDDKLLYNAAVIAEPGVAPRYYRKTHLPDLGVDKFVLPGGSLDVFDTKHGRIGVLICFDQRMPEPARVLALRGAEIIALPTNWPEGAECSANYICVARAAENRVFMVASNRVGAEKGFPFIGKSKIIDVVGNILAEAGTAPTRLIADVDLAQARQKRTITVPGKFETAIFGARRPELYGELVEKNAF